MFGIAWTSPLGAIDLILGIVTFVLLLRSGALRSYWPLLYVCLWSTIPYLTLLWLRQYHLLSTVNAYHVYFLTYWVSFAFAAVTCVLLTYTIFNETLNPLHGLQNLGRIMYRWVLGISCAVMLSAAMSPGAHGFQVAPHVVSELMRLSGIVVLCLLLFVGFTVRPLGLTFRSRTFGVSVGMAVAVIANIFLASGILSSKQLWNSYNWTLTLASIVAQMIWIWYFSMPEPPRRFVLLATTSPFHHWNAVSERMGYDPGYVAISGVPPESLAEAERAIFERIAEQDSGRAPRLKEVEEGMKLPPGWASSTVEATAKFNRMWNARYGDEKIRGPLPRAMSRPVSGSAAQELEGVEEVGVR